MRSDVYPSPDEGRTQWERKLGKGVRKGEPHPERPQTKTSVKPIPEHMPADGVAGTPRLPVLGPGGSAAQPLRVASRMLWQNERAPYCIPDLKGETPELPPRTATLLLRGGSVSQKAPQPGMWWQPPQPAGFTAVWHSAPVRMQSGTALVPEGAEPDHRVCGVVGTQHGRVKKAGSRVSGPGATSSPTHTM